MTLKTRVYATLWDERRRQPSAYPVKGYVDGYVYSSSKDEVLAVVVSYGRFELCSLIDLKAVEDQ